ncbi:Unknown protein [Striga hermonthica]|uniref:KIB1-4 beta-propeller domain-containing protein n=1 Tax=Striga hermonthica TaxID=68872 RepID=A0A9N7MNI6_STRHE|nr:Unknown protein [Striga hermonthica]
MGEKKKMMMKKNKEKKSPKKKIPTGRGEEKLPYLPIADVRDWGRLQIIRSNMSETGGITKSWVVSSPSCNLNQPPPHRQTCPQLALIGIPFRDARIPGEYSMKRFCHQRQVTFYSTDTFLSNLFRYSNYGTHSDYSVPLRRALTSGNTRMVVTGLDSPAFAFSNKVEQNYVSKICYYSRRVWKTSNCRVIEPFSATNRQYMEFTNAIGLEGKFYAISLQGSLAIIEDSDGSGDYEITRLGTNRAVPSKPCRHFREYLVRCESEIFLVLLLSMALVNVVDDVEVFRLDEWRLCWEKVERLSDDAVFFVQEECCLGMSASFLGCKSRNNCVYFRYEKAETWFCFDMKTRRISTTIGPVIDRPMY